MVVLGYLLNCRYDACAPVAELGFPVSSGSCTWPAPQQCQGSGGSSSGRVAAAVSAWTGWQALAETLQPHTFVLCGGIFRHLSRPTELNGHIASLASSLALALRSGRSTLAVAGVFGAGKTRSLTFLLAWLALTTHLKIAVVHKENPAGRAITKLLTAFELEPDHQRYFIRPVGREEAEANTACTDYDLRASEAAPYIPGCHVVIVTTGLVWDQKGQTHSTLNTHMENVDLLISEEAQQDMDLKSAFAPAVPRQAFFRLLLGDPKQSGRSGRRARFSSKPPLGCEPQIPGTCRMNSLACSMRSFITVEALGTLISKKQR